MFLAPANSASSARQSPAIKTESHDYHCFFDLHFPCGPVRVSRYRMGGGFFLGKGHQAVSHDYSLVKGLMEGEHQPFLEMLLADQAKEPY